MAPGNPLQASAAQDPNAQAYPVRNPYIVGEPLPPGTNVMGGSARR
jgi:hypothetical protein